MEKAPDAFRTISEVSELLDTPPHVLRFWESRFSQLKPVKRAGGRRYYRPSDLLLLGGIKRLLHDDGMTIRGVQKMLSDQGVPHVAGLADPALFAANEGAPPAPRGATEDVPEATSQDAAPEGAVASATPADDAPAPVEAAAPFPEAEAPPMNVEPVAPAKDMPIAPETQDAEDDTPPAAEAGEPDTENAAAGPDQPVTPAPPESAPAVGAANTDTPSAETDLFARIFAGGPFPETTAKVTPEAAPAPAEPEAAAMPEVTPDTPPPTLAHIAARLRRLAPEDVADNRAKLEALRARLLALHTRRSERLVGARF